MGLLLAGLVGVVFCFSSASLPGAVSSPEWVGIYDVQGKAGLLWIKAADIKSYKVYRRRVDENTFSLVGETENNRYTDGTLQPRITYYYRLVGLARNGQDSSPSAEVAFTLQPKVKEAVGAPSWEGYLMLEKGIGLKWEHLDPELVVAYNVYRTVLPDGKAELLASTRENAFTDYRVEDGKQYRYWITALDGNFKETAASPEQLVTFRKKSPTEMERAPTHTWTPQKTYLIRTFTGGGGKAIPFRSPADLTLSPSGLLFVADSGNGLIQVFNRLGDYKYDFPVPSSEVNTRSNPLGITVDREGKLYVSDAASGRIIVFQPRGSIVRVLFLPRLNPKETFGILGVRLGSDGRLYVVDNLNGRVAIFDAAGQFTRYFGQPGLAPGHLTTPGFCAIDGKGRFLVSEALTARLQIFSPEGEFIKAFGRYGKNVGGLARPKGIAVDSRGRIYIADSWTCQIQAFDEDGKFLFVLADEKGKPLDLGSPNGIAIDDEGNIYIAERLANRVQIRHLQND